MGLLERVLTTKGRDPFQDLSWTNHDVHIQDKHGQTVFKQDQVEFPATWSEQSVQVVSSKYFSAREGAEETSLKDLIGRVVGKITLEGDKAGYFPTDDDAQTFRDELTFIVVNQLGTFNSPVWFSIGLDDRSQRASACYIVAVEDSLEGILDWYKLEGLIFKGGSGSGVNISSLRGKGERIAPGGVSSGSLSFMKAADASSGAIKSAGTTRRSAKMVIMNDTHPDLREFIVCKVKEEEKAQALIQAGFDGSFEGEVASSLAFQNANNSVRASDEFLWAVEHHKKWYTKEVVSGLIKDEFPAEDLLKDIAKATWSSGDPGMQFDDQINRYHTCPMDGRQTGSNPCSEYLFLDWTSCNLATINLLKFQDWFKSNPTDDPLGFNRKKFEQVVRVLTLAQDILIGFSESPIEKIDVETKKYRTIGINYANLGAYLMSCGVAYASSEGREFASHVSSLMTAYAYTMSAQVAERMGAFERFYDNREPMLDVLKLHRMHAFTLAPQTTTEWNTAVQWVHERGARNAQVTLAAPTGTVSFMLGCDTTGVEPPIGLTYHKTLAGGGSMTLVNNQVSAALSALSYPSEQAAKLLRNLEHKGVDSFLAGLEPRDKEVFDCALPHGVEQRFIDPRAHIQMVAAIQPFLSGGISKTVNVPADTTVEDIMQLYMMSWRQGLKSVAIYRDGSKQAQPLTTRKSQSEEGLLGLEQVIIGPPYRRKLPDERPALTHKFSIGGLEGYITVGLFPDNSPGEVFISVSKQGTTLSGLADGFATLLSLALQYGVPLEDLVRKFSYMRFEPMGYTTNPDIRVSTSIIDYLFRWLEKHFLMGKAVQRREIVVQPDFDIEDEPDVASPDSRVFDSPMCLDCGGATIRSGTCHTCTVCYTTQGCS